jgi:hypothetical protein
MEQLLRHDSKVVPDTNVAVTGGTPFLLWVLSRTSRLSVPYPARCSQSGREERRGLSIIEKQVSQRESHAASLATLSAAANGVRAPHRMGSSTKGRRKGGHPATKVKPKRYASYCAAVRALYNAPPSCLRQSGETFQSIRSLFGFRIDNRRSTAKLERKQRSCWFAASE